MCSRDYRPEIDLGKADSDFSLHSVTGKQLNIYGRRIVWYAVEDGQGCLVNLCVTYVVCDPRRPIVATASLVDRGCRVELGERSCIEWGGRRVPLRRVGNRFILTDQPCSKPDTVKCMIAATATSSSAAASLPEYEMVGTEES